MATAEQKSFRTPDETRPFEKGRMDLLEIGGSQIGCLTLEPPMTRPPVTVALGWTSRLRRTPVVRWWNAAVLRPPSQYRRNTERSTPAPSVQRA